MPIVLSASMGFYAINTGKTCIRFQSIVSYISMSEYSIKSCKIGDVWDHKLKQTR